jgi:hypothetical protein
MTMRKNILTVLVVPLIVALTAQVADASEHHHTRTKACVAASGQYRNANAYAAPSDTALQSDWSSLANGAMASGLAGR